uniref:Reverse transcriptase domain-containing protein n=1 Tax=Tanacetum cinerariifolium TaxID=118510 RepID=A0A6L2LIY2_TANCI|nr:reverse transcriptase domain-containing protein [Tanacetum cinerariifolium]
MDDNQTMAKLLQAPTEGYEDAIVIPEIAANNFELKNGLINLVQNKQFFRHDKEDPHAHIRYFNKITSTMRVPNIIESKSKVRQSRAKAVIAKVGTSSSTPAVSFEVAELKDLVRALLFDKKNQSSTPVSSPASVKAVEPNCVTYGGAHSYQNCPATSENVYQDNIQDFTDALTLMPKFASTLKDLIGNKEKLIEMARTPMNEHCLVVILNKLPRKHRDPEKFLIPCEFLGMDECLVLADLGAIINLMPFSIWEALLLKKLTPMCMTLELVDHSVSKPISITKDVSFKVEVLGFSNTTTSGNPTPHDDPIVSTTSPTLTLFGDSDFLLFEEADAFLGLDDDPNSPKINPFYYDPEGDILLLETILNSKPLPPLPNHKQYLPSFKKELKVCEAKTVKSSVEEPPQVELKDLPPHLEYAFLEGENNLPVIIAKELGDEEKSTLLKVLKSHKRAIAWKLSDIQGINPEFCTHKILMEEDYKPAVQHQRRVNHKIHDIIKKEVEKLLDARLIYPISDSPWVSPVHCVPKKGGFTIVDNEENELILTYLVIGRRVCIDYQKLNEATRKDNFHLLFMDQMLERLAENKLYCFPNGFSRYFEIPINPHDQEKTMFTCPYGMFAYRRMPFGLCNAPGTFQRCMLAIFHDMAEKTMEVFMEDFSVFGNSFQNCLSYLDKMLQRCEDTNLSLNWEKSHFMVKVGIVLGHKIYKNEIEVDRATVNAIAKLPHPTTIKGAVLGQRHEKHFKPIHYASKMMNDAKTNYTTTEKEILAVVYAFKKFRSYLIMNKSILYMDHSALKYLFAKKDAKARLLRHDQECRAPKSQDRERRDTFRQVSKVEELTPKALMAIDGEFALMAKTIAESKVEGRLAEFKNQEIKFCEKIRGLELQVGFKNDRIESLTNELELVKKEKGRLETKLTGFQSASKDLDSLLESQRLDKNKEGLRYSVFPPLPAQVYSPPKKDMSWTSFLEFEDDTITDYSRPSLTIKSTSYDVQNRNASVTKTEPSPSTTSPKPFIKKFHTGNTKFSTADMGNKGKAVKASACWFLKPSQKFSNKGPKSNNVSVMFKKYTYIDTQGNISYLTDYEPFDGGYVSFGQGGCKITGKGTIKIGKLEFENVYFVKDLKVLVNKSYNKTPYELFIGRTPAIGFLKPFGCHIMILNTLDHLGKFEAKGDEGYFTGYSMSRKAFRVYNKRTKRVEENLHVNFLENKAIEKGAGPNWLFDIDSLTESINYVPVVVAGINSTNFSGIKDAASQEVKKDVSSLRYIALSNWIHEVHLESSLKPSSDTRLVSKRVANQVETPSLDNILTLTNRFEDILGVTTNLDESIGVESDINNMETTITASPTLTLRIHKDHPKSQIIGPVDTPIQTGHKSKEVEAIQEELLQFKIQNVWSFVDCPKGIDVKSAFLYGTINDEVYVMQPPGFQDPEFPTKVYKVEKAIDCFEKKLISVDYIHTDKNVADLLTKPFDAGRFQYLVFWSIARIETMEEGTKILATVDVPTESLPTRIAQSLVLSTVADEPASPLEGVSQDEACPTDSGFEADQDKANICKTSTLPSDSTPRVTSLAADEGTQELEINILKARIKLLEDKYRGVAEQSGDDALIKGRSGGVQVVPTAAQVATATISIPTGSGVVSTASLTITTAALIFTTATESTSYTRRKGKETMVESETPKKKKDNYAKVLKYQTQQRKPLTRKQQREFYTLVLRNQAGWKAKHFKGMTLEEIKEKFDQVWKQIEDFVPIGSKEEVERFKRKGLRLEQESVKKLKTSEEVKETEEVLVEKVHTEGQRSFLKIIRLGGSSASYQFIMDMLKYLDKEDLNQLWRLVKESLSIRPATSDKEMEIWVELKRLYEPEVEDQLWTHTQNLMHALVEWKMYDTCGVHHVSSKDKEIFMLVEKDNPLRKCLAIEMISYKLQVENYSKMANDLIMKIYKIVSSLRKQDD